MRDGAAADDGEEGEEGEVKKGKGRRRKNKKKAGSDEDRWLWGGLNVRGLRDCVMRGSVGDPWYFGADPYLWLMDPDPTPFFSDFKDEKKSFHIIFL